MEIGGVSVQDWCVAIGSQLLSLTTDESSCEGKVVGIR